MSLFCVGMYAASFGPVLPFIADDLGVSLDTAGLLLTALFFGSISASAVVAIALHGHDTRLLTIAGLVSAIAGVALLGGAPNWPVALFAGLVLGIGDGLIIAALHILMGLTSHDVPSAMNRLNLFFALGAIVGADLGRRGARGDGRALDRVRRHRRVRRAHAGRAAGRQRSFARARGRAR